jgi:hypothetical protein
MRDVWLRSLTGAALLVGLIVPVGCSARSGKVPVTGSVLVDGAPGSLTVVTFWAEAPNAPAGSGGRVVTNDKGEFAIGAADKDTGLAPGTYKVTFSRFLDKNGKAVYGGGKKTETEYEVPSKESIPDPYRDRATTPVSVHVARDSNTFKLEVATAPR